jgi:hypothetical protein
MQPYLWQSKMLDTFLILWVLADQNHQFLNADFMLIERTCPWQSKLEEKKKKKNPANMDDIDNKWDKSLLQQDQHSSKMWRCTLWGMVAWKFWKPISLLATIIILMHQDNISCFRETQFKKAVSEKVKTIHSPHQCPIQINEMHKSSME